MPLPGTIPTSVEPEAHGHFPPFIDSNGNLYRITEEPLAGGNNPQMAKSTDGGQTWAFVDVAGQMAGSSFNDMEGGWSIQSGTTIMLAFTDDTNVFYATFNTSDAATNPDTWQVKENGFVLSATSGSRAHVSIARLSDGRVRAIYMDAPSGSNFQIAVSTKTSATAAGGWSAKTVITPTTSSYAGPYGVVGAGDKLHLLFHDFTNKTIQYRTLTSANVLSAMTRVDTAGTSTVNGNYHGLSNPVYYDNGGQEVIAALYAAATGVRLIQIVNGVATDELVDSANPLISPNNDAGADTGGDSPVFHLAVHGTTLHMVMTDAATGDVVHRSRPHGGSWSARTTLWTGTGEAQWLYNNVYSRNGAAVMGYTYDIGPHADDGGNIQYNELSLSIAFTATPADTAGGSDSVTTSLGYPRTVADPIGGTDSATTAVGFSRTAADSAGGTDSATTALGASRTAADSIGGTDSVDALISLTGTGTDSMSGADSATKVQALARQPADALGGTDSATKVASSTKALADTAGISDSVSAAVAYAPFNDALAGTDSTTVVKATARTVADTVAGSDSITLGGTLAQPILTTANVVAEAGVGVRHVHRLRASTEVTATATGDLKKGPQRAILETTVTGELLSVRRMASAEDMAVDISLVDPEIRIVRSMTTRIRTPEEVPMSLAAPAPAPEPASEPISDAAPVPYTRVFQVLR